MTKSACLKQKRQWNRSTEGTNFFGTKGFKNFTFVEAFLLSSIKEMAVVVLIQVISHYRWAITIWYSNKAGHSDRAISGVGLVLLGTGTAGSNPPQDMDVCLRISVLCCPE